MLHRVLLSVLLAAPMTLGAAPAPDVPNDAAAVAHALSRLTYGARPGEVERVQRVGLARWIDDQLHPSRVPDPGMAARLAALPTLTLDAQTISRDYVLPAIAARRARERDTSQQPPAPPQPEARGLADGTERRRRQPITDLTQAKILRAVYSERQLEEILVDFWFNHFNVSAAKGRTEVFITEYERDVIRPRVFGSFRDLLGAVAKSPAMLFYLDNAMSRAGGLNENYARELLELHTLGVDGGYTQQDVVEIARAFTGWTIDPVGGRREAGFRFASAWHDRGAKTVLGHPIDAGGGLDDGERVLDIVASHPSTARHIATKLATRFVSDAPPAALVERAAERFRATRGDLRETVRVVITSPEFFAADARQALLKTPLEFVVSAIRASDATLVTAMPFMRILRDLGMPPFLCQPPTGYDDTEDAWVSTGALVARLNFANDLAHGRIPGVRVATADPAALAARLGAPEFQRQ
ncbi:MAG: DUF1800 domain-containing protein [Acidobacteriota bacterium]